MRNVLRLTVSAVVAVIFAIVGNVAAGMVSVPNPWKPLVWLVTGLLGIAVVLFDVRAAKAQGSIETASSLEAIITELADVVRAQWIQEEDFRARARPSSFTREMACCRRAFGRSPGQRSPPSG